MSKPVLNLFRRLLTSSFCCSPISTTRKRVGPLGHVLEQLEDRATPTVFTNAAAITIPSPGAANPYPSQINVSGEPLLGPGSLTVTLSGLTHTYPDDLDILLVSPAGQTVMLMSDAGGGIDLTSANLTFSDNAFFGLPNVSQITSGTYKPTDFETTDNLSAPAPQRPFTGTTLSAFDGTDPNGVWSLYVADDYPQDSGTIANGWSLSVNTPRDASAPTITGVSSTASDGTYGVDTTIPITVTFDKPVGVTGTPRLTLETGATDAVANYIGGNGTNILTFKYTVSAGESSPDLDYISTSALSLNGGTIRDLSGNDAILTLPDPGTAGSLGANKNIVIHAASPSYPVPELMYYRFDGTGTSVPNEASSPVGSPSATIMGGLTQGGTGEFGGGLVGSGNSSTTDYLNTGWATNLSGSWTISLYLNNIPSSSTLFYFFGDSNASNFRCFTNGVAGANNLILRGPFNDVLVPGGAQVNTPTVTDFVYDSVTGNIKAYVNGILVNTVAQPNIAISGTGPFKVNGYATNVGNPAGGVIDEFRMYNRALSADEISATWNQPLPMQPEVAVSASGVGDIADEGIFDFGSTPAGTSVTRTFTVTNSGSADLTLANLSVPAGFSITSNFGKSTLAPGGATTFRITMGAATPGTRSGMLSFDNNDANENPFNFTLHGTVIDTAPPVITSLGPSFGPASGGTIVTIMGTSFTGATAVNFGGTAATFTVDSSTQITAIAPPGVGTVYVTVTTGYTSNQYPFVYIGVPTVTGISPNSGPTTGGTTVTITGKDFTFATAVDFGGTAAGSFVVNSDTQITATSPAGTGTVDVTVTGPGGTSLISATDQFTYFVPSKQYDFQPSSASPLQAGSLAVLPGTGYTVTRGYGWTKTPGRTTDAGALPSLSGNPLAYQLRDYMSDFGGLSSAGIFRVDFTAADAVQITAFLGDARTNLDGIEVAYSTNGVNFTPFTPGGGLAVAAGKFTSVTSGGIVPGLVGETRSLWIRFQDIGGSTSNWSASGFAIRSVTSVGKLTVIGPQESSADGMTVDTFTITGATPGAVLTISASLGTILTDARPELLGNQVIATDGTAQFQIRCPFVSGTSTITVSDFTGAATTTFTQSYTLVTARKFDMNYQSPSLPDASWIDVRTTSLYTPTAGYGWTSAPSATDTATNYPAGSTAAQQALYRDYHSGMGTNTFRAYVGSGQRTVKLYTFAPGSAGMTVSLEGGAFQPVSGSSTTFNATVGADGILDITFRSAYPFTKWAVNAIEVF